MALSERMHGVPGRWSVSALEDVGKAALEVLPDVVRFIVARIEAGSSLEEAKADARAMFTATDRVVDELERKAFEP